MLQITRYVILSLVTLCAGISLYERGRPQQEAKEVEKSNTDDDEETKSFVVKAKDEEET